MKYHEMHVDGKDIKLRIRMRDHAELDKISGGDFFATLTDEATFAAKAFKVLGDVMWIGMRAFEGENGKYTRAQVDDMIDGIVDDGYDIERAVDDVMRIAAVSGFFPRDVAEAIMTGKILEQAEQEQHESQSA